ncbi:unnamed protein product [Oikopleura dioica]|uniref:Ig-like domain-containing protein n=1 Tax=Oikopleura dioica TaxID=34765 RepID=E4YQ75_OIKDI|nr:unnamed protein product [Oikopleura dioica]
MKKRGKKIGVGTCFCIFILLIVALLAITVGLGYYFFWPKYQALIKSSLPADGAWSSFSPWSECSTSCGLGQQSRIRFCLNRKNEGKPCEDSSEEQRTCNAEKKCPDCSRKCEFGSLNKDCTKCTCEDHRVTGKVSDSSGQAIAGASIRRKDYFIQTLAYSDLNGEFSIIGICSNGKNSLMASKVGFNPSSSIPVEIQERSSRVEITLSKVSLPRLLVNPQSKIRFVGQSARLCCSAQDDDSGNFPLRLFWYKNEELIDEGERYNQTSTDLKLVKIKKIGCGNVYSVEICPSTRLQQGNCAVTQQCAHPEQHLFLDDEKCVDEPSNYCCKVGESQKIEVPCPVPGRPDASYAVPIQNSTSCACLPCD